jgi:hypothetical protein
MSGIDWEFIQGWEGGQKLEGYVPINSRTGAPLGKSGVTVASGVDVGQMSAADIRRLSITPRLANTLAPYALLKRDEAVDMLKRSPLTITKEDADALDRAMRIRELDHLEEFYNQTSAFEFFDLPSHVQTVLFSIAWRAGARFGARYPRLWDAFIHARWSEAAEILEAHNWGIPGVNNRSKAEAAYLRLTEQAVY